jgi:multiple sugar transport system ATP-binding protein
VELVEALGSESLVHFRLDAQRVVATDSVDEEQLGEMVGSGVARVAARTAMTTGDRVSLALNESALHFFDPGSGLAVGEAA